MVAPDDTKQWTASARGHILSLIPPLSVDFIPDEPARQWALRNRYLLASGIPPCAHGLYLMDMCPKGSCRSGFPQLDHARVWVPADTSERPFLLSHAYSTSIADETRVYASAHGLILGASVTGDDWYGHGSLPVRMQVPDDWPLWPIEASKSVLLAMLPVRWPDD